MSRKPTSDVSSSPLDHSMRCHLPSGWLSVTLGDLVSRSEYGTSTKCDYSGSSIPVLRIPNIALGEIDALDLKRAVTDINLGDDDELQPGDVLICRTNGSLSLLGKAAVIRTAFTDPHTFASYLLRFRFLERDIFPRWIHLFLSGSGRRFIETRAASSAGQHNISLTTLHSMPLPLAPLNEQRRIVSKIEELFSDLDAGVLALKRAKANLKRYRAAVLNAAVDTTSSKLSASTSYRFGELIFKLGQGWSPKCDLNRQPEPDEWAIIKTTAVQAMKYSDQESKPLPENFQPRPEIEVTTGDFLMTRKGPRQRAGVTCLVRNTRSRLMVCDTVYRFRCRPEIVNADFLEIVLNSPSVVEAIDRKKCGISDSGVSLTHQKLYEITFDLPPLEMQLEIVSEVSENLSQADAAEALIDHGLLRSARLRQSILKQAFEGKLAPQDPNDEPASVMLDKLHGGQTEEAPKKQRRTRQSPKV